MNFMFNGCGYLLNHFSKNVLLVVNVPGKLVVNLHFTGVELNYFG